MNPPGFGSLSDFLARARPGMVPVVRQVVLDGDTPVAAFAKLHRGKYGFLLESLEGGERWARYTFLSTDPREVLSYHGREIRRWTATDGWRTLPTEEAPLDHLARTMRQYPPVDVPGLPRFTGGAVGYIGYDVVRSLARLPHPPAPGPKLHVPGCPAVVRDLRLAVASRVGVAAQRLGAPQAPVPAGGRARAAAIHRRGRGLYRVRRGAEPRAAAPPPGR